MQTALVTGASAGFGAAIARQLLHDGMRVVLAARRHDRLAEIAAAHPGHAHAVPMDVSRRDSIQAALASLPDAFARIDVLVNNAGLARGLAPAQEADTADWDEMIATNCAGLVHVTRALLPGMVERGSGTIVNLGSIAGEFPYPGGNVYGATKAFVHQFTQNLNADLIGTGVRATCIEPGLCGGTEFSAVRFKGDLQRAQAAYQGVQPLTAEDIADTVSWVVRRPAHVTINTLSMMPNCQSFAPLAVRRT
ncbi:MAG: SDR family NAD(P)-dependent oxidoreductase [Pseudomonadota bacterium]